ncbi:MAG: FAD-binding oxidoreductase [Rhodobacteraceae bacterium]|nr:FAD-binding oxidoreductase [Paracoccaceae bacterium]
MKRIYGPYAYGPGPRDGCWWDQTVTPRDWPRLAGDTKADVVVVGAGFTGLNAALALAEGGASVVVLDAEHPGWGASGRNGGFCCLGGGRLSDAKLAARHGADAAAAFHAAERAAVDHVAKVLRRFDIDADVHSDGETQLAHDARRMDDLRRAADRFHAVHGAPARLTEAADLPGEGLGGRFFGALTIPFGFALNPRRYLEGLLHAAAAAGVRIHGHSPATAISRAAGRQAVRTPQGTVTCDQVLIATNGYSSEDLPDWMAARYMPTQSTVLVTRPLSDAELATQGWTSNQMSYDTLNLLHYFRLMPDRRFLFGMRGGLLSTPGSEARARRAVRRDFERLFPAWAGVESPHMWSGMVCLSAKRMPFVGPVPDRPGLFASFAYHGNGVGMGSFCGWMVAQGMLHGAGAVEVPRAMAAEAPRFPLGAARRAIMPAVYGFFRLADM